MIYADKEKIEWINGLKAIGILAVILGHIASPFSSFIFSWHMPLFFMIAGFFIKFELPFRTFAVKNFNRLMIPYFIFAFIGLGAEILKRMALHRENLNYIDEIKGILVGMDMNALIHHYGFVLWFLPALFFAKMILYGIQKITTNILFSLMLISIFFGISFYVDLPFAIDNAFNASFWIFIGYIFFNFYQEYKLLYILPLLIIPIGMIFGIPTLDMASKSYSNIAVNIIWVISVIYSLIAVLKKLNCSKNTAKLFTLWGGNTMLLFILHPYTNNIAHIMVEKLHFGDWYLNVLISLALLQIILFIKLKLKNKGIFKYV